MSDIDVPRPEEDFDGYLNNEKFKSKNTDKSGGFTFYKILVFNWHWLNQVENRVVSINTIHDNISEASTNPVGVFKLKKLK